jgi:hypothetical protein
MWLSDFSLPPSSLDRDNSSRATAAVGIRNRPKRRMVGNQMKLAAKVVVMITEPFDEGICRTLVEGIIFSPLAVLARWEQYLGIIAGSWINLGNAGKD